jgi:hypothetical protein
MLKTGEIIEGWILKVLQNTCMAVCVRVSIFSEKTLNIGMMISTLAPSTISKTHANFLKKIAACDFKLLKF